ncbi:MAG: hypothetical protein IPH13_16355 [Planctomycetes bacterium]|nr:hypothetical protein [Planctomycetota bacterium]MCC7170651.1 hypothetical protein [Planctomycetota bacterium]
MIVRRGFVLLVLTGALGFAADEPESVPAAQVDFKLNDRLRVLWDPSTCTLARTSKPDGVELPDPLVGMRWAATRLGAPIAVTPRFVEVVTKDGKPEIRYVLALEGVAEIEVAEAIDDYTHDDKGRPACWRRFRIGELPHGVVLAQTRDDVSLAAARVLARSNATWTWGEARFVRGIGGEFALVRTARFEFPQRGETIVTVVYDA